MSTKRIVLPAGLFFLLIAGSLWGGDYVPSKVYVEIKGQKGTVADFWADQVISGLSEDTNVTLIRSYQITNFTDSGDALKFLLLNRLHGLTLIKVSRTDDIFKAQIHAYAREKERAVLLKQFEVEFSEEKLLASGADTAKKIIKLYPQREKQVVMKEEVERVKIGKFEYLRPTLYCQAAPGYLITRMELQSETNVLYPGQSFDTNQKLFTMLGAVSLDFRYRWFGWHFQFAGSPSLEALSLTTGPSVYILKGLLGFQFYWTYSYFNSDVLSYRLQTALHSIGFKLLVNVTSGYSLALDFGSNISVNVASQHPNFLMWTDWELEQTGLDNFGISQTFRLKGNWYLNVDVYFGHSAYDMIEKEMTNGITISGHINLESARVFIGATYKWEMGGAK